MVNAFADGEVPETGTEITKLMPAQPPRFVPANACTDMKARVIGRLKAFFERFSGMSAE